MIANRLETTFREFVSENNNLSLLFKNNLPTRNISNRGTSLVLKYKKSTLKSNPKKINSLKEELNTLVAQLKLKNK